MALSRFLRILAGYNCKKEYLQGKGNVCVDLLASSKDAPREEGEKPLGIDEVNAINSNHFEPRKFASDKNEVPYPIEYERPVLPDIDKIREQDADKDILDLKQNKEK